MFHPFYHPLRQALLNDGKKFSYPPPFFDSLQDLTYNIPPESFEFDRSIDEVDLSRAVIIVPGFRATFNSNFAFTRIYFTSSTNARITRGGTLAGLNNYGHFFVVEFSSSQINSLQPLEIHINSGVSSVDSPIYEIDLLKSVVFHCGHSCDSSENFPAHVFTDLFFQDSTTVRAMRGTTGDGHSIIVSAIVLECK